MSGCTGYRYDLTRCNTFFFEWADQKEQKPIARQSFVPGPGGMK